MTDTTEKTQAPATPRQVFERIQQYTLDLDMKSLADLYTADATHEWPFPPMGVTRHVMRGQDEIRRTMGAAGQATVLKFQEFRAVQVHETVDPEVIIIEYELHGVLTDTGRPFQFSYIMVLRVRNGEIVSLRDYFDPLARAELTGRLPERGPKP